MKRLNYIVSILLLTIGMSACSSVALTGRSQLNLVPDDAILSTSSSQYAAFMKQAKVSTNKTQTNRVRQIGQRIANATEQYLRSTGMPAEADKFQWEFNLVASNDVNAFCMPGGKIVVYEGLLPVAENDAQLATVMSHEVAHALAKHANERMSQQIVRQYGASALGMLLSGSSVVTQQVSGMLYNVGTQVFFSLPYSRKHEYEADKIGLYLMAIAGYDYNEAEKFWMNMSQGSKSTQDILSTHPADQKRIKAIREELPKVRAFISGQTSAPKPNNTPANSVNLKEVNKNRKTPIKTHY